MIKIYRMSFKAITQKLMAKLINLINSKQKDKFQDYFLMSLKIYAFLFLQ